MSKQIKSKKSTNKLCLKNQISRIAPVNCKNCHWRGVACETLSIQCADEKLRPGDTVPVGECPTCHTLVYLSIKPCHWCGKESRVYTIGSYVNG